MIMKTDKTDKEIIAEFHGGIKTSIGWKFENGIERGFHLESELKYDTSWDWLMPVVEKINKLINTDPVFKTFDIDIFRSMQDWLLDANIKPCFDDIVLIIKWYNSQPKP